MPCAVLSLDSITCYPLYSSWTVAFILECLEWNHFLFLMKLTQQKLTSFLSVSKCNAVQSLRAGDCEDIYCYHEHDPWLYRSKRKKEPKELPNQCNYIQQLKILVIAALVMAISDHHSVIISNSLKWTPRVCPWRLILQSFSLAFSVRHTAFKGGNSTLDIVCIVSVLMVSI